MENNYSEDIVPPARKSIKDIPLPARKNRVIKNTDTITPPRQDLVAPKEANSQEKISGENFSDTYGTTRHGLGLWFVLGGIFLIFVVTFFIFNSLDSAVIKITPKSENVSLNISVPVSDFANTSSSNSLNYRTIELAGEVEKVVDAEDEELVQEKASGVIRILNSYSEEDQKLIKNTRFESEKGKIYRIQDSVTVPGYTKDSDKITPGQIEVTVYADEVGEDYNISSSKFTVPGFKDQEQYDFFSAETVTAIGGGFDGIRKIISSESLQNAKNDLTASLTNKLIDEVQGQITDDFILVYNNQSFIFEPIKQEDVLTSDQSKLKLGGKISAKVFNKIEVSNAFAKEIVASYSEGDNVLIDNFADLKIDLIKDSETSEEKLQINGDSKIVWQIDENSLKNSVLGFKKEELNEILKNYSGIIEAKTSVKPFWRSSFPKEAKDIKIEKIQE